MLFQNLAINNPTRYGILRERKGGRKRVLEIVAMVIVLALLGVIFRKKKEKPELEPILV